MNWKICFMVVALLVIASPMFGQSTDKAAQYYAAGFSMAFASGICGLAQGKAISSCAEAMARNPGATAAIRFALLLGLVFIESLALYSLVIVFVKVG